MGGFIRRIFRSFSSAPAAPAQVQQVQQVAKGTSRRVSKPYSDDTIMTSAEGLEDEANVQKTVLGGETNTTKKKKKYA